MKNRHLSKAVQQQGFYEFRRQMEYKLSIPDQFTEKLYVPIQHYMVWSASFLRRIQQGSVRLYISYVMVAMLLVLIWGAM